MSLKFTLTTSLYPRPCLEQARAAFAHLCSVAITHEDSQSYDIEITSLADDTAETRIAPEFLNYLLTLSIEHHLAICREPYETETV